MSLMSYTEQKVTQQEQSSSNQIYETLDNQTNSIAVLLTIGTVFQNLTQVMKDNKGNLKELISLTPNSCKEECKDKKNINYSYQNFSSSIMTVDKIYSNIPSFIFKFKRFLQLVSNLINQITNIIYFRIENNQGIDNKEIQGLFKKQIDDAQTQYDGLIQYRDKFEYDLQENDVVVAKNQLQNATKIIFQLQFAEKDRDVFEEVSNKIADLKIQLGHLISDKDLKQSQLQLAEGQMTDLDNQLKEIDTQKEEIHKKHKQQLDEISKCDNEKIKNNENFINLLENQIQELSIKKQQNIDQNTQKSYKLIKFTESAFQQSQEQILNMSMGAKISSNITILDESGSMRGDVFNQCAQAVKQMVIKQKQSNPDDEFCLIQFDDKARITINLKKCSDVDENEIGTKFKGGKTNFQQAFQTVIDVIPLCSQNSNINILFFTDGSDNSSKYEEALKQLKNECGNRQVTLFCLGYGKDIDVDNLKKCLITVNGNSMSKKLLDGKSVQTLYQVNSVDDILETFKKVSDQTLLSTQEFKEKAELKADAQREYKETFTKISNDIMSCYDQNIQSLNQQKENLYKAYNQTSKLQYEQDIKNIQEKEIVKINDIIKSIKENQISTQNQISQYKKQKQDFEEQIKVKQSLIYQKEKIYLGSIDDNGNDEFSNKLIKNLREITSKSEELGFINKEHFDQFYSKLESAEILSKNIQQFKNNIFLCIDKINTLLQNVIQSIYTMSQDSSKRQEDPNNYFKMKIVEYMNKDSSNSKQYKPLETYELFLDFIKRSDTGLSHIIEKDEDLRKLTDLVIQNLQNLEQISQLTDKVIVQKANKGEFQQIHIGKFIDKIFFKIYKITETNKTNPEITIIMEKIKELNQEIDKEENDNKIDRLTKRKDKLQEDLEKIKLKQDDYFDKLEEEQETKLRNEKSNEYNHIERIIKYLHSSLKSLESFLRQEQIFIPIRIMKDNFKDLECIYKQIQYLSITY